MVGDVRSCLAFSISLGEAAFLCDGMDGMVDDAERMAVEFIRWAAIRSDGSMVDCFAQDYNFYLICERMCQLCLAGS